MCEYATKDVDMHGDRDEGSRFEKRSRVAEELSKTPEIHHSPKRHQIPSLNTYILLLLVLESFHHHPSRYRSWSGPVSMADVAGRRVVVIELVFPFLRSDIRDQTTSTR